jgi:hypothetical protein
MSFVLLRLHLENLKRLSAAAKAVYGSHHVIRLHEFVTNCRQIYLQPRKCSSYQRLDHLFTLHLAQSVMNNDLSANCPTVPTKLLALDYLSF